MRYVSTRAASADMAGRKRFCEILLEGLAPDGGLYLPEHYPQVDAATLQSWREVYKNSGYAELAFRILSLYIDDIAPADLRAICHKTYTAAVFGSPEIVPLRKLEDGLFLEALSNGPTLAFKDLAMQLLGNLFEYELARRGEALNVLGATSGDTGSAAEYAMRGKQGLRVFMISPNGRMSPFQQAQMFSLLDENIHNISVDGVFDDCQDIVKAVSNDLEFKRKYKIGTVNSINWARLLAQVVYYFAGYFQATQAPTLFTACNALPPEGAVPPWGGPAVELAPTLATACAALPPEGAELARGGPSQRSASPSPVVPSKAQKVSFTVPSGNFGNVCAGHVARMMGLPIQQLVVATNENDVLDEFFRTGVYRVRASADTHETSSPSMDISKASNFERFVFDLLGRDGEQTRALFGQQLGEKGFFDLSAHPAFKNAQARFGFASGKSTHADRLQTIRDTSRQFGTVIDTHTADGLKVARQHLQPGFPMVVLETALPIKFAATIEEALGHLPARPACFEGIEALPRRVQLLPADAALIKAYIAENA